MGAALGIIGSLGFDPSAELERAMERIKRKYEEEFMLAQAPKALDENEQFRQKELNHMATVSATIVTPPGMLSFASLFKAKPMMAGAAGEPKFAANLVFDDAGQKHPAYAKLKVAIMEVAKEAFGEKVNFKNLMLPLKDGSEKEYSGYGPGTMYISATSKEKPGLIDVDKNEILDPSVVWAGQTARFSLVAFSWDFNGKKGVSLGLRHVQILDADKPRMDGRASADKDFANDEPGYTGSGKASAADADMPF